MPPPLIKLADSVLIQGSRQLSRSKGQICRSPIKRQRTLVCRQMCDSVSHIVCGNSLLKSGFGDLPPEQFFEVMPSSKTSESTLLQQHILLFIVDIHAKKEMQIFQYSFIEQLMTTSLEGYITIYIKTGSRSSPFLYHS